MGRVEEGDTVVAVVARRLAVDQQLRDQEILVRRRPLGQLTDSGSNLAGLVVGDFVAIDFYGSLLTDSVLQIANRRMNRGGTTTP